VSTQVRAHDQTQRGAAILAHLTTTLTHEALEGVRVYVHGHEGDVTTRGVPQVLSVDARVGVQHHYTRVRE
jgi:hypothetical protein